MSISGTSTAYMGIFAGNTIKFKGRKNYANIFKLDMVMINTKERKDNNLSDSDNNKNYKKIKISKPDKYYGEQEKFEF